MTDKVFTLALANISDVGFCTKPRDVIQAWANTPETSLELMSELISLTDADVEVRGKASKKNLLKKKIIFHHCGANRENIFNKEKLGIRDKIRDIY